MYRRIASVFNVQTTDVERAWLDDEKPAADYSLLENEAWCEHCGVCYLWKICEFYEDDAWNEM